VIYRVSAYHLVSKTFLMLSIYIHTQYTLRTLVLDLNLASCEMMGDNLTATARNNGKLRSRRDKLSHDLNSCGETVSLTFNPLNAELNPICYLLALLGAHHFLHVSRLRVKLLTFRLLMSYIYIYGAPILDVSRSHTTTQHSR